METCFDFLKWLGTDMSLNILLMFLDDPSDLIRASSVSRSWLHFVIANGLCKQLCVRMFPQLATISCVTEVTVQSDGLKKSVDVGSSSSMEWDALERDHRVYASLFRALTTFAVSDCIAEAISASSTDRYPEESIVNTLDRRNRFLHGALYWSSKGYNDPEVPETLTYKLRADFCVISEISIQPFQADYQPGSPIYSAKSLRFRMGHCKSNDIKSNLTKWPSQQCDDDKFIWTYTSQEFPMTQENQLQKFKLPESVLCIGGFLQIELLGRVQRQHSDNLFFICVSYVEVIGRPLFRAFDVEILEPSGKLSLKYYPEAFSRALRLKSYGPC